MVKKTTKKPARKAGTKIAKAKAAKPKAAVVAKPKSVRATTVAQSAALSTGGLGKSEIKKIQEYLQSKNADDVTRGLSLLESRHATKADYEAVFTQVLMKAVLNGWVAESWGAVARAIVPHRALSESFQKLAEEKFKKRPRKLHDFNGLLHARIPLVRAAYLLMRGGRAKNPKPFLDLVKIPAGSFVMGSPASEIGRDDSEQQVKVQITKPFQMGRTVVTQGQWRVVMGTEPWLGGAKMTWTSSREYEKIDEDQCGDEFPAVFLSWDDATLFCQTLTDLEREAGHLTETQAYRLPTEAEWEYACRAGTTTAYSFGDNPEKLGEYAWYGDNSEWKLRRVGGKKQNPWGLYDMHGLVQEWCADWYDRPLAGGKDPVGPSAVVAGKSFSPPFRVLRSGELTGGAGECRSAYRGLNGPGARENFIGFRVVRCG